MYSAEYLYARHVESFSCSNIHAIFSAKSVSATSVYLLYGMPTLIWIDAAQVPD